MIALGKSLARDAVPGGDRQPPQSGDMTRNTLDKDGRRNLQEREDYSKWSRLVARVQSGDETGTCQTDFKRIH